MTMQNKFAGTCHRCQETVPAGDGLIFKDGARWLVQCNPHGGPLCPVRPAAPRAARVAKPMTDRELFPAEESPF